MFPSARTFQLLIHQLTRLKVPVTLLIRCRSLLVALEAPLMLLSLQITISMKLLQGRFFKSHSIKTRKLNYFDSLRLINCNVAHAEHSIYPIHSFNDDQLCFDKSRKDISLFQAKSEKSSICVVE